MYTLKKSKFQFYARSRIRRSELIANRPAPQTLRRRCIPGRRELCHPNVDKVGPLMIQHHNLPQRHRRRLAVLLHHRLLAAPGLEQVLQHLVVHADGVQLVPDRLVLAVRGPALPQLTPEQLDRLLCLPIARCRTEHLVLGHHRQGWRRWSRRSASRWRWWRLWWRRRWRWWRWRRWRWSTVSTRLTFHVLVLQLEVGKVQITDDEWAGGAALDGLPACLSLPLLVLLLLLVLGGEGTARLPLTDLGQEGLFGLLSIVC